MKINGYLNDVELKNNIVYKNYKFKNNMDNELLFIKALNRKYEVKINKLLIEKIPGDIVTKINDEIKRSLIEEINIFHSLEVKGIREFDWYKYIKNSYIISEKQLKLFNQYVHDISNKKVTSHNDINFHNIIWDNNKIHLIDFEWAALNHPYFDYVNFFIHENIILRKDLDINEWNKVLFITLCFFLMWSEDYKKSEYVQNLKTKYLLLLSDIII